SPLSVKYQFFYAFTDIKPAVFIPIPTGLLISFGLSTKFPLTFFPSRLPSGSGAVRTNQALALPLIASGAAAAFIRY
ncbi:MAG: hypothetical protein WC220_09445, partial [Pedobacter sp.]